MKNATSGNIAHCGVTSVHPLWILVYLSSMPPGLRYPFNSLQHKLKGERSRNFLISGLILLNKYTLIVLFSTTFLSTSNSSKSPQTQARCLEQMDPFKLVWEAGMVGEFNMMRKTSIQSSDRKLNLLLAVVLKYVTSNPSFIITKPY